jgi:hypothetical protein
VKKTKKILKAVGSTWPLIPRISISIGSTWKVVRQISMASGSAWQVIQQILIANESDRPVWLIEKIEKNPEMLNAIGIGARLMVPERLKVLGRLKALERLKVLDPQKKKMASVVDVL